MGRGGSDGKGTDVPGTSGGVPGSSMRSTLPDMTKRWLSAVLWLYAGWWLGNFISDATGISELFGPALGTALAVLIAGDPFHVVWPRPARVSQPASTPQRTAPGAI